MFSKILKKIKSYYKKCKLDEKLERIKIKNDIIKTIYKKWSKKDVINYNIELLYNSGGNVGGGYSEQECKLRLLTTHKYLFSEKRIDKIMKDISDMDSTKS